MKDMKATLAVVATSADRHGAYGRAAAMADLERGRAVLRRRRAVGAGGGLLAAALLFGGTVVLSGTADRPVTEVPPTAAAPTVSATAPAFEPVRVATVAYTGEQPEGFRVAVIPEGWIIETESTDTYNFVIKSKDHVEFDPNYPTTIDKISVYLESEGVTPSGRPVDVDGVTWWAEDPDDELGLGRVFFPAPDGRLAVVQYPDTLGWSTDDALAFTRGVEVLPGAEQGVG